MKIYVIVVEALKKKEKKGQNKMKFNLPQKNYLNFQQ
jgi:hypothetical protein